MPKVAMSWAVGEKSYQCPVSAGDVAKADGKKVEYVVGNTKTTCKVTASVELAKARVDAAILALEQVTAPKDAPAAQTEAPSAKG